MGQLSGRVPEGSRRFRVPDFQKIPLLFSAVCSFFSGTNMQMEMAYVQCSGTSPVPAKQISPGCPGRPDWGSGFPNLEEIATQESLAWITVVNMKIRAEYWVTSTPRGQSGLSWLSTPSALVPFN